MLQTYIYIYIDLCDKIKTQQYFKFPIFILMNSPLIHNTKTKQ